MIKPLGEEVFNPLDKTHLAESVKDHLLKRPVVHLPPPKFFGAGIYALYYTGRFAAYHSISDGEIPVYVGKAVPPGTRKGGHRLGAEPGDVLYRRLSEHAASIRASVNLDLAEFRCRYLLVDDIWIPLGESLLIETFKPVWNVLIDGFGHHDQGKARRGQMKSAWDTLHPGRPWAEMVEKPNTKSAEEISKEVISHLGDKGVKYMVP
ncbi:MAG: Eco29kI family restriction endonuclease [Halieaceae bacterium]|nr:Eco29kI family restriction endonuclease [Halieaceae bacterium]